MTAARGGGRSWWAALSPHAWAVIATILLGIALALVIVVTTPWQTLPQAVPGGPVVPDPARDFTPAQLAREDAYHSSIRPPAYTSLVLSLVLALVLGFTRLGGRLIAAVTRPLGGGWFGQVLVGALAVSLVGRLATLPFSARAEAVRRDYGLSTRDWGSWSVDVLKSFGVDLALVLIILTGVFVLARRWSRWWWAPVAAGGALLVAVVSFAYPVVVEPVFNDFESMEEEPLRTSLLELAAEDGVTVEDVLVADASRRTTQLNAYVSGFGPTRRIVVYDTALAALTPDELRLITAHELGHVKNDDVLHGTLVGALGIAFGACLLYLALSSPWVLRRAGLRSVTDPRSVALVLALAAVMTTVSGPVVNLVSRRIEARADVHALDLTRDPGSLIAMQRRLAVTNLSDLVPHPIVYGLFRTHPSAPERIALARDWARIHTPG